MSALIKIKTIQHKHKLEDSILYEMIVVPFITKFSDKVVNDFCAVENLKDFMELRKDAGIYKTINIYNVLIERNFTHETLSFFSEKEANNFIKVLKNSINDLYANPDAYIKFIK